MKEDNEKFRTLFNVLREHEERTERSVREFRARRDELEERTREVIETNEEHNIYNLARIKFDAFLESKHYHGAVAVALYMKEKTIDQHALIWRERYRLARRLGNIEDIHTRV